MAKKDTHNNQKLSSELTAFGQKKEYCGIYPSVVVDKPSDAAMMLGNTAMLDAIAAAQKTPIIGAGYDALMPYGGSINWFVPTAQNNISSKKIFMRRQRLDYEGKYLPHVGTKDFLQAQSKAGLDLTGGTYFPFYVHWSHKFGDEPGHYPIIEYIPPEKGDWRNPFVSEKVTFAIQTSANDLMIAAKIATFGGVYNIVDHVAHLENLDAQKKSTASGKDGTVTENPYVNKTSNLCGYLYEFWKWLIWSKGFQDEIEERQTPGGVPKELYTGGYVYPMYMMGGRNPLIGHETTFRDYSFSLNTPFIYNTIRNKNIGGIQTMYVRETPDYNYYIKDYEEAQWDMAHRGIKTKFKPKKPAVGGGGGGMPGGGGGGGMPGGGGGAGGAPGMGGDVNVGGFNTNEVLRNKEELLSPNMYMFLSEQQYLDKTNDFIQFGLRGGGSPYHKILTLDNQIKGVLQDVIVEKGTKNVTGPVGKIALGNGHYKDPKVKYKVGEKDVGDYFVKWSKVIQKAIDAPIIDLDLISQQRNICFLNYHSQVFKEADDKRHLFPMNIGIEFSTTKFAGFADLLQKTNLTYSMISFLNSAENAAENNEFYENLKTISIDPGIKSNDSGTPEKWPVTNITTPNTAVPTWDVMDWWKMLLEGDTLTTTFGEGTDLVLPLGDRTELFVPGMKNKFYKHLLLYKFRKYLKEYVNSKSRSFSEIVDGKEASSEVLLYRIEKVHSTRGTVIQNIWIPNSSHSDIIKYYDTQVMYNRKYNYNIYAYVLTVGSKYEYDWDPWDPKFGDITIPSYTDPPSVTDSKGNQVPGTNKNQVPGGVDTGALEKEKAALTEQKFATEWRISLPGGFADLGKPGADPSYIINEKVYYTPEGGEEMFMEKPYTQWFGCPALGLTKKECLDKAIVTDSNTGQETTMIEGLWADLQARAQAMGINVKALIKKDSTLPGWAQETIGWSLPTGFKMQWRSVYANVPSGEEEEINTPVQKKPTQNWPWTQAGDSTGTEKGGTFGCPPQFYGRAIATVSPEVKIMEVHYHTISDVQVVDSPPVYPEVDIVPYRGRDDKVKINLRANAGRYFSTPIWFNEKERQQFEHIQSVQHRTYPDNVTKGYLTSDSIIMFESDEPVKKYEVYKMTRKPTSYTDFGRPIKILEEKEKEPLIVTEGGIDLTVGLGSIDSPLQSEGVDSFVDRQISPNRKYYYTFRAVDKHHHVSNPTPVYELEIVNNSGAIYSVVKIVEFAKPDYKAATKPFRKYMQIVPTFEQKEIEGLESLVEEYNSACAVPGGPKLGSVFTTDDDDIAGRAAKRFKIRLTSRSTGKKIDVNVRFTHKHDYESSSGMCIDKPAENSAEGST